MAEVVDLQTHSTHRPNYTTLARRRISAARRASNMTAAEFAETLTPLVGWPVTAKAVEAWETNLAPPGEVILAAESLTEDGLVAGGQYIGSILSEVPPSFSAGALTGYWVTCFQFHPEPSRKHHVDVALITAEDDRLLSISNHVPAPRSEGRASPFRNDLQAQLANRHVIGHWKNSSDARYFGTFHLAVLSGESVMTGFYTGFGSDVEVSTGPWKWVRLSDESIADVDLSTVTLKDPAELGPAIESHSQYASALTLTDIQES